jgi:hypothetical protein
MKMDKVVPPESTDEREQDAARLARIGKVIPLLADVSRADILLGVPRASQHIEIIAQAQPTASHRFIAPRSSGSASRARKPARSFTRSRRANLRAACANIRPPKSASARAVPRQ